MIIKITAMFLIILGGAFFGIDRSDKLKKRAEICHEIEKLLHICEFAIKSSDYDVYSIARKLKAVRFKDLSFIKYVPAQYEAGRNFRNDWENAVLKSKLEIEEKQLLSEFGRTLGTSDTDGQLKVISAYIEEVHSLYEQRKAEYTKKGKLYRSLGVLGGIMAGIIMI